ncbi:MAG: NAD(P)/FAD-dependent oxidoreductase [Parvicellaceae bacterium]
MQRVDFLVIGQGLAGTTFAHAVEKAGKSLLIIDNCSEKSSSFAAAGIINPISFKRLILSWKAELLIPFAKEFYKKIDSKLAANFFSEHALYRIFSSIEEQNNWHIKLKESTINKFISQPNSGLDLNKLNAPFGYGKVNSAARLDVAKYVLKSRAYFLKRNKIKEQDFKHKNLSKVNNGWVYKNILADNIVFCEGPKYTSNPFFNYLPAPFTKGETLTVKSATIPNKFINKGCFSFPLKNNTFLIGSTYNHKDMTLNPTPVAKEELELKLKEINSFSYTITNQKAGIRPTTTDRRPIIGKHPAINNLYIFNGLGSKGVMLAPYFSNELIQHVCFGKPIDSEANVQRYTKKHFKGA